MARLGSIIVTRREWQSVRRADSSPLPPAMSSMCLVVLVVAAVVVDPSFVDDDEAEEGEEHSDRTCGNLSSIHRAKCLCRC